MTRDDLGLHFRVMERTTIGTVRCPLLIGRDDLLELVDRRLADVLAGRGQMLLVAGEAGIGKSRFLSAIDHKAMAVGSVAAWGFVAPQDRDVPAASILDMARSMLRDPRFAQLGGALLHLRDATLEAEQVQRRALVMDVVDRILRSIDGPTLLGFDDLQWADDLSLEIIGELARRSRDRSLLVCGGYRTDEAPIGTSLRDWRSRLLTQRIAEEVRLKALSRAETALVTTLILDTGLPAPREVAEAVYERTDGVPLHIEELLGALDADARANGLAIREATVPDTIEDAVLARLSHRSPEAQAVARAGAIVGRCFVPDVLAGIMDLPEEAIEAPLQELVDHFVLEAPGLRGLYDFRHQLLRDAIYRSVPIADRRRYHARAGEFGAQLEGQSEIHSSLHYERAGLHERAFEAALAGARDAARLSAHREAFELYRRAVANAPEDLDPLERARILEAYAEEAGAIEENEVSGVAFEAARDLYLATGEPFRAAFARSGMIGAAARLGSALPERRSDIIAELARIETLPAGPERDEARAFLEVDRAIAEIDAGEIDVARATVASYSATFDALGNEAWVLDGRTRVGMTDILGGDVDGGLEAIATVAAEARAAGAESVGVTAYRDAAMWAVRTMRYAQALTYLDEGRLYADSIEQSHCSHLMLATSSIVDWADGDWPGATAHAQQAISDRGCLRAPNMARWTVGFVALGQGDVDAAEAVLSEALRYGEGSEVSAYIVPPLWGLAEAALLGGRPDEAFDRCQGALERCRTTGERALLAPFLVTGVRALQAAGRPSEAPAWLEACEDQLGPLGVIAGPAVAHARGLVALADGATGVARTALETAVGGWDAIGRIWEASWARLDLASCSIRSNRFAEAVPLAVEVRTTASRLDSRPLADRAEALMRQARGRVAVDEPWRPLTAREFAVARLVAAGHTNVEIAGSLGIAPKTASSHVEHILAKLGASRRAEIAAWASTIAQSAVLH
jgi:DNA-binding CsgD family transcriptional regulator/tetratricopeptide (TPR) repeat protein